MSETGGEGNLMKNGYFAALVLLMGLAIPAGAHTGDRVFPHPRADR